MQRIRIRYTKEGRTRYVSARDLTSVWERALRRADLPIAYSEGFTPHAKVSFPDALPVGVASTGEYAELTFAVPIDPGPGMTALSATLPAGMDILTYWEVPDGAPKLARMLPATLWELEYEADAASRDRLTRRLAELADDALAREELTAQRERPNGQVKTVDVRAALEDLRVSLVDPSGSSSTPPNDQPVLRAVTRNDGPTVRPTDLHAALSSLSDGRDGTPELPEPRLHRRVAQGEIVESGLREALSGEVEPLAPGRLAGAA